MFLDAEHRTLFNSFNLKLSTLNFELSTSALCTHKKIPGGLRDPGPYIIRIRN
jgi:hypothetical protein